MRTISLILICATLLLTSSVAAPQRTVDDFFRTFTDEWMRLHTDLAAAARYFSGTEHDAFSRQIEPRTLRYREAERLLVRKGLKELRSFDRSNMTAAQRLSADIVVWDLENRIEGEPFQDYLFPLVQTDGAQVALPSLLTVQHTLATARDAENYVARLGQMSRRMEEVIVEARRKIERKLVPPKFILQAAIAQIDGFLSTPAARNPLVITFAERMKPLKDLPASEQAELLAAAERITAEQVYPAWRKARALLAAEVPAASNDAGIWRLPNGLEAYNYRLRQYTTTRMTAGEIHQTGLRMVAEIEGRMDELLRQLGRTEGSVRARMDKLREDQPAFPATAQGRADYQAEIESIIQDAEKRAALLFERVPKAPVVARPYPEFMGPRAPSYSRAAPDGSRPGTFQFPVFGVPLTRFGLRTVTYHEAIPGHHFQLAVQMEDTALPRFRRDGIFGSNSANSEGWALYAERLAAESGWYHDDPVGLLGQLDAAVFRARRLVVDTGMHAQRWTRERAIDYLGPNPAGSAVAEIDRYVMRPGQACAYMVGELKIVELRERARRDLGASFPLGEFHNVVLGTGRVPLDILEQEVERWIAVRKAK
jgi:uncharacterized protein (DUF885 family)